MLLSCAFHMMTSGYNVHQFSKQPYSHSVKRRHIRHISRQLLVAPSSSYVILYANRCFTGIAFENKALCLEWDSDPRHAGYKPAAIPSSLSYVAVSAFAHPAFLGSG